jgi:hypothetical protein
VAEAALPVMKMKRMMNMTMEEEVHPVMRRIMMMKKMKEARVAGDGLEIGRDIHKRQEVKGIALSIMMMKKTMMMTMTEEVVHPVTMMRIMMMKKMKEVRVEEGGLEIPKDIHGQPLKEAADKVLDIVKEIVHLTIMKMKETVEEEPVLLAGDGLGIHKVMQRRRRIEEEEAQARREEEAEVILPPVIVHLVIEQEEGVRDQDQKAEDGMEIRRVMQKLQKDVGEIVKRINNKEIDFFQSPFFFSQKNKGYACDYS